jgi:pentatricopeptide repeat protein
MNTAATSQSTATSITSNNSNNSTLQLQFQLDSFLERHTNGERLTQSACDQLLAQCVAHNEWDDVLKLLEEVYKGQGLLQNRGTYHACLQACRQHPNGASAAEILEAMTIAGFVPSPAETSLAVAALHADPTAPVAAYNAVLQNSRRRMKWKEALRLLRHVEEFSSKEEQPLDVDTYKAVVECCLAAGESEQAVQVLQSCIRRGLVPTVSSFELVIQALTKRLQWRRALFVMEELMEDRVPKTLSMYNAILAACAKAKEVLQAKNLLVQMRKQGIRPNILSYNAVLAACASSRRWNDALAVLDQCHREPGVSPDIYTYTNAMRACAKGTWVCSCVVLVVPEE